MSAVDLPRWGYLLPSFDPYRQGRTPVVEGARRAEELGFDAGWVGDHLTYYAPLLEPMCALAAAAAVTSRLRLGLGVLLLPMRPVVWVAKQLGTLDALAPGRIILGVGVGGENPAEFEAAGAPLEGRGRRLDEALDVLPALLAGKPVDHPGPLLPLRSPPLEPAPATPPPLMIAGRSPAAVERAGRRGDGWLAVWLEPERVAEQRERLAEAAQAAGRPTPPVLMMVFVNVGDDRTRCRDEADRLYRGQYGLGVERVERWAALGSVASVVDLLGAHQEAGVSGFVLVPASPDPLGQLERFAEVRAELDGAGPTP